jgi:hypothetical protein
MNDWQPIETAPKDGRQVIVVVDGRVKIGRWANVINTDHGVVTYAHQGWSIPDMFAFGNTPEPSHWMPLPDPPK